MTGWVARRGRQRARRAGDVLPHRPGVAETIRAPSRRGSSCSRTRRSPIRAHGRLLHDQRAARAGFGLAGGDDEATRRLARRLVAAAPSATSTSREDRRARVRARSRVRADAAAAAARRRAATRARARDPTQASYYYSVPQLAVTGTIDVGGSARRRSPAPRGSTTNGRATYLAAEAAGWDWIGINLDDGGALMAFRMRDATARRSGPAARYATRTGARASSRRTTSRFAPCARGARRAPASPIRWPSTCARATSPLRSSR